MDSQQKRTLVLNMIKFFIWLILLGISYVYLQSHPAERVSIISWFEVIYDRIQIVVYGVLGKDTSILQQKTRLEQYYEELIRVAEDKSCIDQAVLQALHVNYNALQDISFAQVTSANIQYYASLAYEYDSQIQQVSCD
jgi:hypothetical protein